MMFPKLLCSGYRCSKNPRLASPSQLSTLFTHNVGATVGIVFGMLFGDVQGVVVEKLGGEVVGIKVNVTVGFHVGN